MSSDPTTRRVIIASCDADAPLAREASEAALQLGCSVVSPDDPMQEADLCLILMSQNALADKDFLPRARTLAASAAALIPARMDGVAPELAGAPGDRIREVNWADFSSLETAEERSKRWRAVLSSNVDLYDAFYALDARASCWDDAGRDKGHLLVDPAQAREAQELLLSMRDDPFNVPDATMEAFVAESSRHARRLQRRRWFQYLRVGAAVVAVGAAIYAGNALISRQIEATRSLLQELALSEKDDPALFTLKALCNADVYGAQTDATARDTLTGLSENWDVARLGWADLQEGGWQGEAILTNDANTCLVRGAGGTLQRWNPQTAEPLSTWQVSNGDSFVFDATEDGAVVAVADDDGVALYDKTGARTATIEGAPASVSALALSEDASQLLCQSGDAIALLELDEKGGPSFSSQFDEVLALRRTERGLRALVVAGDRLQLIDPTSDSSVLDAALPEAQMLSGAIGPQDTVVVCADGALLVGTPETGLDNLGATTYDLPRALALGDEVLVVATEQAGVQVVDLPSGAPLGTIATSMVGTCYLDVSNELVASGNGWTTTICSLEPIAPRDEPPAGAHVCTDLSDTSDLVSVSVSAGGDLTATCEEGACSLDASGVMGEPTSFSAVAAAEGSFAAGTESGQVVAYTFTSAGTFVQTRAWESPTGEPITALGWTDDLQRLVVESGGRWWTPYSNSLALGIDGIRDTVRARVPVGWDEETLSFYFPEDFVASMGLTASVPAPQAK